MQLPTLPLLVTSILSLGSVALQADVTLPNIFGDHMVLQREQANPVWGKADAGETVTVRIDGQSHTTTATADGTWRIQLDAMAASAEPKVLEISGSNNQVSISDVLVGEVWICSGQSNMQWSLNNTYNGAVEIAAANHQGIRLISVPQVGTQEAQDNFNGAWEVCSPETAKNFSAVGYLFGSRIHSALGVPVGLIDNAWGGSAAEAWVPRDVLEADSNYTELLSSWDEKVAAYTDEAHAAKLAEFEAWQAAGKPKPNKRSPRDFRTGQRRPANIFNGVLNPTIGYGMRGVIWYQGESNSGRAYQYRSLFPLMITTWRDLWQQGDFPFYWVQLADYMEEVPEPHESAWAELREAQSMTLSLPNTGEAVIIDAGEGRDIHPRDKTTVANRLVRLALAHDYGYKIDAESPRYASMKITGSAIALTFDHVSSQGLYSFDVKHPIGFTIAGADQVFVKADAKIIGKNKVLVSSANVSNPVAVRYAWANNPVANLQDRNGLPVSPFRTDDWPGITVDAVK
ncbi:MULTISPECIES: sialate O-acetylesterase [unclassified Lentimonas]|uniref:sialate O-acetylesterase n=1 Tax=unclassified Lentimonas TaxID=2630993 RepID=UPI00132AE347|nr:MULTISPECIES: sialate O-acetylesterase [unclassified Lentimonas]CAA6678067.1 Sialic acid-specific 9-O-acetylesterase [Lentimonas sp. CC4]CAA6687448.1 Sialic acid-specific 9-O-acetylesterase [Lentimonas sp. CC6]CAA7076352.1 Sialic acid-specific 9-O-acetylesterase [Lentimonas sp. CC4]CAA7171990.1 Sialic acid-specific 9-O-acetylesterase [Lentimonas sp. CC21]CAA7180674.1 Sialic acid-specific 9-O-acetylesterase [Lentimonas sp. CC8]